MTTRRKLHTIKLTDRELRAIIRILDLGFADVAHDSGAYKADIRDAQRAEKKLLRCAYPATDDIDDEAS